MKAFFVISCLVLINGGFTAPQPRKLFHEHFEDFLGIIMTESGDELEELVNRYFEYEEFLSSLSYIATNNFKDLIYEMEALPEFQAVIEFLENDNIDIHYFVDLFNEMLENVVLKRSVKQSRQDTSGRDLSAFIEDAIALFPKDQLAALFTEKMESDEEFSTALLNLQSEEWSAVLDALWNNEVFQREIDIMADHGIDFLQLLRDIQAVFGQ